MQWHGLFITDLYDSRTFMWVLHRETEERHVRMASSVTGFKVEEKWSTVPKD